MLLANKEEGLTKFTKGVKVPEMIISTLFLVSGIYLLTQIPSINMLLIIKIVIVFASIPIAVIGFKKRNKALAVVSFIMIVGSYGLAEVSHKKATEAEAPKADISVDSNGMSGQKIYTEHCSRCHGDDGKLGMSGAADLSVSTLDIPARIDVIKNGKNGIMPAYVTIGDDQIKTVAEYIESLKK